MTTDPKHTQGLDELRRLNIHLGQMLETPEPGLPGWMFAISNILMNMADYADYGLVSNLPASHDQLQAENKQLRVSRDELQDACKAQTGGEPGTTAYEKLAMELGSVASERDRLKTELGELVEDIKYHGHGTELDERIRSCCDALKSISGAEDVHHSDGGTHKLISSGDDVVPSSAPSPCAACRLIAAGPVDEPQLDLEGDWRKGLFCGLEDVDRQRDPYEACIYGFEKGVERVLEWAQRIVEDAIKENGR